MYCLNYIGTVGYILCAFLFLYAIEAGYFAGLLFASKRIRGQTFRGRIESLALSLSARISVLRVFMLYLYGQIKCKCVGFLSDDTSTDDVVTWLQLFPLNTLEIF